ncbi:MAG: bifunctional pyr operon transcriptional regulator/uracil phosphoribosyltransferase PyrR [Candidatus Marinimicrobia bacterium]|nr:bifunctional pyr operon transcriptional regulator/uracil phosphoribosyltransferase PyrR [Candidatus Neomarinimicrobiota bacterium]MBL7059958.1 bifunctional pyr operon transcriptional regulator/uracil phosphoribosyltransferase PyrR [Candidatus Neomarinimicrobiota bacterium]
MTPSKIKLFMDATAISRSVTRLSHEILEQNHGAEDIVLVGIQTRGEPLAERIKALVDEYAKTNIPIGSVDITFHRDDFRERLVVPQVKGTNLPESIDDKTVVLVDDVLYTGRTIRAAIEVLLSFGRPSKIQLAVLVDRGHREMPIKADFVGKNIPTHEGQHVNVLLEEIDKKDAVELRIYDEEASC